MAVDKTLVDAYSRYYGAEAMAGVYNDPTMQMQQMLMVMGQQWIKQKEKDKEESKAFAEKTMKITDRIPGVSLLNPQAHGALTQKIHEIVQQADVLLEQGDMQGYGQAMQQAQSIANQMKDFEGAFNIHAQGLTDEAYSKGADIAALNTIFKKGGGYEMFFDNENNIKFRAPADHAGGTPHVYDMDALRSGMHMKNAKIGDAYETDMLNALKLGKTTQEYSYDDGYWNKKISSYMNSRDNLISAFHDDIFGLTREDGSPITLAEKFQEEHVDKYGNAIYSENWMKPNTRGKIDADGYEGGFNEDAMREYAKTKLKEHSEKEWKIKVNSIIPNNNTLTDGRTNNSSVNAILDGYENGFNKKVNLRNGWQIDNTPVDGMYQVKDANGKLKFQFDPNDRKSIERLLLHQANNKITTNNQIYALDWDNIVFGGSSEDNNDGIITDNTKKKYGWGSGTQSIAPKDLLETLSPYYKHDEIEMLADEIDSTGWAKLDGEKITLDWLIGIINEENKTNINVKHLSKMLRDLAENIGGTGDFG